MDFQKEAEINIDGKELYVIDTLDIDGKKYIYTQEMSDDDLIDNYYIYRVDGNPILITEEKELQDVLKKFIELFNAELGE